MSVQDIEEKQMNSKQLFLGYLLLFLRANLRNDLTNLDFVFFYVLW